VVEVAPRAYNPGSTGKRGDECPVVYAVPVGLEHAVKMTRPSVGFLGAVIRERSVWSPGVFYL